MAHPACPDGESAFGPSDPEAAPGAHEKERIPAVYFNSVFNSDQVNRHNIVFPVEQVLPWLLAPHHSVR
jgi:hypothetical protein